MKPGIFKRDIWQVGILIGIALPTIFFLVLFSIDFTLYQLFGFHITDQFHYLFLLSMSANLFPIRHYLIKLKFEKTGLGLLVTTIAGIIIYFYLFYQPQ